MIIAMYNKIHGSAYCCAVPGPPANLVAEPSLVDCTQTTLRWSPPASDEQNGTIFFYFLCEIDYLENTSFTQVLLGNTVLEF